MSRIINSIVSIIFAIATLTGCANPVVSHVTKADMTSFAAAIEVEDFDAAYEYVLDSAKDEFDAVVASHSDFETVKILSFEDKGDAVTYELLAKRDELTDDSYEWVTYEITWHASRDGWSIAKIEDFYG